LLEFLAALPVYAQVANREESDSSRRLGWPFVMSDDIKKLLECSVFDEISAQCIGISDEIAESTCSIGSCLLFLISEELNKERHAWFQVLVEDIIVEASISNGEAGELPGVPIWVPAALDGRRDEPELQELLIEESSMAAEVSNQIANFGPDGGVLMHDEILEVLVNV